MFNIDMEVDRIIEPGCGVSPELQERTVKEPLVIFRKGMAKEISWKLGLTFKFII